MIQRTELVVDVSQWQGRIRADELRAGGVRAVIVKSSQDTGDDPKFSQHAEDTLRGDLGLQIYHWVDPLGDGKTEFSKVYTNYRRYPVDHVWLDVEQWWSNWGSWYQAVRRQIEFAAVSRFSPAQIAGSARYLIEALSGEGVPVGFYSSYGFVSTYARDLAKILGQYSLWVAHYGRQPAQKTKLSWDALRAQWLPTYAPLLPPGADPERVVGHQFTGDRFLLPGMYADEAGTARSAADVSVFNAGWLASLRGEVQPEPSLEEKVNRLWKAHPEVQ